MENEDTEYIIGNNDNFTQFLFSSRPREKNSIKLELDPPEGNMKLGLHIFQELLMIFTAGMKYFHKNNVVHLNINKINKEDLEEINQHFQSFGYNVNVEKFTVYDYLSNMKMPNYFLHQELIKEDTPLDSFYYETTHNQKIYRIYFDFLR